MHKAKDQSLLGKVALLVAFGLTGCNQNGLDNQIEKCVQAGVKMKEPYTSDRERAGQETWMRIKCLEAASGQKNQ